MDTCNHARCGLPGTVQVYDDRGALSEVLCRQHAVEYARAYATRYAYRDALTGQPFIRITMEVLLKDG